MILLKITLFIIYTNENLFANALIIFINNRIKIQPLIYQSHLDNKDAININFM